jgi:glycerol-3-phosphate O-acyltransferase / dihydroxyacetone phosphate acyltransferase
MIGAALRRIFLGVVRLFYPRIAVAGGERLPATGPVLLVANHPNALLDPVVLRLGLGRPVAFLAKSTLFRSRLGRATMDAFGALPVYRPRDGEDTGKNEETFERCRALLRGGGWLAMFPEGTTHSDPRLKPLKTGAARIALSAERSAGGALGLSVVPIGLLYEDKDVFRTRVALSVGAAIPVADLAADVAAGGDERAAVEELTARIHRGLADVVLEADSAELWRGFLAVAAWTERAAAADVAVRERRARELARAYRVLRAEAPERAREVERQTRRYVRVLRAVGVSDPLALDDPRPPSAGALLRSWLPLVLAAPLALAGAVLGWLPYRLVRPAATRLARDEAEVVGTYKALLGVVVMTAAYGAEAAWVGLHAGAAAGLAVLAAAPACGLVALRFHERLALRREALRALFVRATSARIARAVTEGRRELAALVEAELRRAAASTDPGAGPALEAP